MLILKTTKLHEAQNRFQIDNYELSCTKASFRSIFNPNFRLNQVPVL